MKLALNDLQWLFQSISLDLMLLRFGHWDAFKKVWFILLKYLTILKHFAVPFSFGDSHIGFFGRDIYYDSAFGLAGYQSMLTRLKYLVSMAKIPQRAAILDIGANAGFFSLVCTELHPQATIHSFEPVPSTFQILKKNSATFPKIKPNQLALADKPGQRKMAFSENDSAISVLSDEGNIDVTVETVDRYVRRQKLKKIDLMKIDVESFENQVLMGATKTLAKTRYLMLEVTIEDNTNYTISDLFGLLVGPGYNFQLVGFRNFSNTSLGYMPIMDTLLINTEYGKKK